jgi:hypothetical protein
MLATFRISMTQSYLSSETRQDQTAAHATHDVPHRASLSSLFKVQIEQEESIQLKFSSVPVRPLLETTNQSATQPNLRSALELAIVQVIETPMTKDSWSGLERRGRSRVAMISNHGTF